MPDFESKPAPVKFNTAAIIREEAQLRAEEEAEAKRLKDFEMNLRDDTEYQRWIKTKKEQEEIETLEHRQKMKIEMELCREEAKEAQIQKERDNHITALQMKTNAEK